MSPLVWIGLVVLGAFVLSCLIAFKVLGPHAIHHSKHEMTWVKCQYCTAGTQWFDGKRWGPIPEHARRVTEGVFTIEPPQGNVKKCRHCLGTPGGHWVDKSGPQPLRRPAWRNTPKGPGEDKQPAFWDHPDD